MRFGLFFLSTLSMLLFSGLFLGCGNDHLQTTDKKSGGKSTFESSLLQAPAVGPFSLEEFQKVSCDSKILYKTVNLNFFENKDFYEVWPACLSLYVCTAASKRLEVLRQQRMRFYVSILDFTVFDGDHPAKGDLAGLYIPGNDRIFLKSTKIEQGVNLLETCGWIFHELLHMGQHSSLNPDDKERFVLEFDAHYNEEKFKIQYFDKADVDLSFYSIEGFTRVSLAQTIVEKNALNVPKSFIFDVISKYEPFPGESRRLNLQFSSQML